MSFPPADVSAEQASPSPDASFGHKARQKTARRLSRARGRAQVEL